MSVEEEKAFAEERRELVNRFWTAIDPDVDEYSKRLNQCLYLLDIRDLREIVDQLEYEYDIEESTEELEDEHDSWKE